MKSLNLKLKMKTLKLSLYILLICLIALILVLSFNTLQLKSYQLQVQPKSAPTLKADWESRLSQAIQIPTVNHENQALNDTSAFAKMIRFVLESYPLVSKTMEIKRFGYSLLYRWKGKSSKGLSYLYMAHLDVVPIEKSETEWIQPPFSGAISEGFIWGRGAMDIKNLVCGILEAAEYQIAQGFTPENDIYFAFGQDEETGGKDGNGQIAQYLEDNNIRFQYVLDEGLFILNGVIPGVSQPIAFLGVAEKGSVDLELTAFSDGGHASNPPRDNAVATLSKALVKINQSGFPRSLSGVSRLMFTHLAPEMSLPFSLLFGNIWLFEPILLSQLDKAPTMSTIRTTVAPTMLEGSQKANVLPQKARAVLDLRILPGETQKSAKDYITKVVNDPKVSVDFFIQPSPFDEPSPISCVECQDYNQIHTSIKESFENVLVTPALFVARSDSKYYVRLAQNVYRFNPLVLNPEDISRFHGINERISVENYKKIIHFYIRLFEKN
jgi:carboxypeptidase PM20D1